VEAATLADVLPALSSWRRSATSRKVLESWRYAVSWRPHAHQQTSGTLTGSTWVVVCPDTPPIALADALEDAGAALLHITGPGLLTAALEAHADAAGVLSLLPDTVDSLRLIKEHAAAQRAVPLWHLTSRAVQTTPDDAPPVPEQAQTWGLGRVAALEHPGQWGGLVDLPADARLPHYAELAHRLADTGPGYEDQLAIRDDVTYLPRLVRAPHPAGTSEADGWRPEGTVLVTGGTGALGPHIARWLVQAGAEDLVLTSRRGASADGVPALVAELEAQGVRVTVAACDVSDRDAVAQLVKRLDSEDRRVGTVVHAAASMRLDSLDALTPEEFEAVVEAKVAGARHLEELLTHHPVSAFVLFSSIAGVWGSGDHGAYAAANAYLDAFALRRRARGLPATSVAWGVWGSDQLPDAVDPEFLRKQGLPLIDPDTAFAGLQQALEHDETFVAVADVDWARFLPVFASARPRPLLDDIPEVAELVSAQAEASGDDDVPEFVRRFDALPAPAEREKEALALVVGCLAAILGRHGEDEDIAPKTAFKQLGVDSLLAVELRNRLGALTGLRLPATLVFEHPTPLAVAGLVVEELTASRREDDTAASGSVEEELARLESALARRAVHGEDRGTVAERLRAMLAGVEEADAAARAPQPALADEDEDDPDLEGVSDDEIFELLDKELGDD
jgi:NADP-dependent 3-hydroxy acid dehydrogenase YdfG